MILLLLYVAGLAGVSRIFLRAGAEHYGFYLLVPGLLGMAVLAAGELPRAFAPGPARLPAYLAAIALLASAAWMHHTRTQATAAMSFGQPPQRICAPHGTLPCQNIYAGTVDRAIQFLIAQKPGAKVVALPEGAAMAFLAGDVNPLGLHTFLPIDLAGAYNDAHVISRLAADPPDFILVNTRDVSEYGKSELGIDYGQQLMSWVAAHYSEATRFESSRYVVLILRRN